MGARVPEAPKIYPRKLHENSKASIPEKLHHCQRSKKWFTWHVISIIAENKSHAHHETIKFFAYNESLQNPAIVVLLIKILIFLTTP